MITLHIPVYEKYDEDKNEFFRNDKEYDLHLEHSLYTISKWEAIYKKPFMPSKSGESIFQGKSEEEIYEYFRCMVIDEDFDKDFIYGVSYKEMQRLSEYIADRACATVIYHQKNPNKKPHKPEIITAELIYYWLVALQIPFKEVEHWHLNRLLTFVEMCNIKQSTQESMPKNDILKQNAQLNAARRAALHTKG